MRLNTDIRYIKGVGEKRSELFKRLGIGDIDALLHFYPRAYEDWSQIKSFKDSPIGEMCCVKGIVAHDPSSHRVKGGMTLFKTIITDGYSLMNITIFNNKYAAAKLKEGGYVGNTVTLGIRPEHLHDDADFVAAHAKQNVTSEIKVYEMLGAETLLYFDLGDASWVATVNPKTKARTGSTVTFALDESKIHVFDKETEKTITN